MISTNKYSSDQYISDGVITLRRLKENDVSDKYVSWLNNLEVNRFLECRLSLHTIASTRTYIASLAKPGSAEFIFGIYIDDGDNHIGNIKIGPINSHHKHATVGLIIGEISEWGKGYASKSIRLISEYAIRSLGLESLNAGCYSQNIGSYKAFLKAGWKCTGKITSHWLDSTGSRSDGLILSYKKPREIHLPGHGGITLIGGGNLMFTTACHLRKAGYSVLTVFCPRHIDDSMLTELRAADCEVIVTQDLNSDDGALTKVRMFDRLCLCFGPAWIFREQVLRIFDDRIFNFNGIPLPDYLGGAHFTWQILNRDLTGGAYIQQITTEIDRGMVIDFQRYTLPRDCKTPLDYYKFNDARGIDFIISFFDKHLRNNIPITESNCQPNWNTYTYFPRLSTEKNGWINWMWDGRQIEDFCNAFDDPYSGAMSTFNGHILTLKKVLFKGCAYFHPYCYGLIVYSDEMLIRVAVKGGYLEIALSNIMVSDSVSSLSRGDRLITPLSKIEESFNKVRYNAIGIN